MTVKFKSTKPLTGVTLMAAEGSIDPATGAYTLRISGQAAKTINIEVAEFSKFTLTAIEGEISADNVAGAFTVRVVPTDAFGNPSLRIENSPGAKDVRIGCIHLRFQQRRGDGALRSADGYQHRRVHVRRGGCRCRRQRDDQRQDGC